MGFIKYEDIKKIRWDDHNKKAVPIDEAGQMRDVIARARVGDILDNETSGISYKIINITGNTITVIRDKLIKYPWYHLYRWLFRIHPDNYLAINHDNKFVYTKKRKE